MVVRTTTRPQNLAELLARLGGIPPERVRTVPPPGAATEADLLTAGKPICELIDGILVEKAVGDRESFVAATLIRLTGTHVDQHDLGVVLGADGHLRLGGGQLRAPDVSYIPWTSFPGGDMPDDEAYWSVAPALAVEVLNPGNTAAEMDRKLGELFSAGTKLAWLIDPAAQTAKVYTSRKRFKLLDATGTLDGGKVLPGFKLSLAHLFATTRRRKKKPR